MKKSVGFNWGPSAVSTTYWTGFRLSDLLKHCGAKTPLEGARYVHFKGVEKELPQVRRLRMPVSPMHREMLRRSCECLRCGVLCACHPQQSFATQCCPCLLHAAMNRPLCAADQARYGLLSLGVLLYTSGQALPTHAH